MLAPLLSALGFAAAAATAPWVLRPWPVADATAFAALSLVMAALAIDAPRPARKDPS